MRTFFERLKEERKARKLNQTDFGRMGGVNKGAQIAYEKGERRPSLDYLDALAAHGVDTVYVLLGQRFTNQGPGYSGGMEKELLALYEQCDKQGKETVLNVAKLAAGVRSNHE